MTKDKATLPDGYFMDEHGEIWSYRRRGKDLEEPYKLQQRPNPKGYLYVSIGGKSVIIHQLLCARYNGPRPSPQHEVCHVDGSNQNNAADNLYWGTKKDNAADRARHGRTARGERNGQAKLTAETVLQIRSMIEQGFCQRKIAKRVKVSQQLISLINRREQWAHV